MQILNCTPSDVAEVLQLYREATAVQTAHGAVPWPAFEPCIVEAAVAEKRQWKIVLGETVACVWSTAFEDPLLWEGRAAAPAVYLHRIATRSAFRGNNLVSWIAAWAVGYARQHGKDFVRMDTVGNNERLIAHYEKCGFRCLGLHKLTHTEGLPAHYYNATVSLFEIAVNEQPVMLYAAKVQDQRLKARRQKK